MLITDNFLQISLFIQFDKWLTNRTAIRLIKKWLLKNVLHKRCWEQKNLHVGLENKIQFIRSTCDGITWFLLYKSIQHNVKKEENDILKTHQKKLWQIYGNGLEFSIPPRKLISRHDSRCRKNRRNSERSEQQASVGSPNGAGGSGREIFWLSESPRFA